MIEQIEALCALDGPSGAENSVREYLKQEAQPFADEIKQDSLGNLMVFRRGEKSLSRPVMLAAHMDEVGVIVKRITEDGMLKFGFVGGVDARVVIGRRIRFGEVHGVVGIKAVHLTTAAERKTMPKADDLYIDIGADSHAAAEARVSLGAYGAFDTQSVRFGNGLLRAKAIDDRLGCAVLLTLLKQKPPVDTWFVFTVQEEVGLRGAGPAAYALRPFACLVVEGTTAADLAGVQESRRVCALRQGAVIPFMDGATIYDGELFSLLRGAAETRGIPWQTKHRVAGGTDAGRIHRIHEGIRVCAVAAPVRYIHSPSSVAAVCDMEAVYQVAEAFLQEIGGHI